jgi:hypothetical protein
MQIQFVKATLQWTERGVVGTISAGLICQALVHAMRRMKAIGFGKDNLGGQYPRIMAHGSPIRGRRLATLDPGSGG